MIRTLSGPTEAVCSREYCNVAAQALGLDPAGHARYFEDAVVVETPLPWKRTMYERAGALPQEMIDLLALWRARYQAGQPYNHCPLMVAPDPAYSQPGHRRIIFFSRQPGPIAHFDRVEYLAPEDEVGPLVWALYEAQAELERFEPYRVAAAPAGRQARDLLVCTHGSVDVACGKFGYPLYRRLRDEYANDSLRVWRVSHFGGHVFAPTLLEMPTGHFWAYVGEAQAEQIALRCGDVAGLRGHYRGWAGMLGGFAQAAECATWQREGWAWFDYAKACRVAAADTDETHPHWMELEIDFVRPGGTQGCYEVRVEIGGQVYTRPHTGRSEAYTYPQYVVTRLESSLPATVQE
ncbi:MAG TPA: sucrase ferredoxin [Caldilineaceae bacterium]|nr:sucrase ferredoxin [Caldilineaceae bacterium]